MIGSTLIVFARAPQPGRVKTRLIPLLGAEGAAALHRGLVEQTLATARDAGCDRVELYCAPDCDHAFFLECAALYGVGLRVQADGDLGVRMRSALASALTQSRAAIVIGSDCAVLQRDDLREAVAALAGKDAVLGPAEDGGYYLLGLRRCEETVFEGIAWGSTTVSLETRRRFERLGWDWQETPLRWDIDRPEDYLRLRREGLARVPDKTEGLRRQ